MQKEFERARKFGHLAKKQTFITSRAMYEIRIMRYEGEIFFFKYKDGELVECVNLSKDFEP